MRIIVQLLINTLAILVAAYLLPGVEVANYFTAVVVAVVLGFLNTFFKPLLIILTIPVTIFTLGLFLIVINAIVILLTDSIVDGFHVVNFSSAIAFSIVLWLINTLFERIQAKDSKAK